MLLSNLAGHVPDVPSAECVYLAEALVCCRTPVNRACLAHAMIKVFCLLLGLAAATQVTCSHSGQLDSGQAGVTCQVGARPGKYVDAPEVLGSLVR